MIQRNQGNPAEVEAIVRALDADGHAVHLIPLEKGAGIPEVPGLPDQGPVLCHGAGFVTRALHHPRLAAGLFFDPELFRWSVFQRQWADSMLSQDGQAMSWEAARPILKHRPVFLRPDEDSKAFDGGIYDADAHLDILPATAVIVATPVTIETEWRFFVVNREIVGCSPYRLHGRLSTDGPVPHRAIDFAGQCAERWGPAEVYCLDIGESHSRLGIIEANCFNAARFYAASIPKVLRAVSLYVGSSPYVARDTGCR